MASDPHGTYAHDLALLGEHTPVVELTDGRDARVAVTPAWQGRVMTSALAGPGGASFGWLNRSFIAAGRQDPVFSNYGGEDQPRRRTARRGIPNPLPPRRPERAGQTGAGRGPGAGCGVISRTEALHAAGPSR